MALIVACTARMAAHQSISACFCGIVDIFSGLAEDFARRPAERPTHATVTRLDRCSSPCRLLYSAIGLPTFDFGCEDLKVHQVEANGGHNGGTHASLPRACRKLGWFRDFRHMPAEHPHCFPS